MSPTNCGRNGRSLPPLSTTARPTCCPTWISPSHTAANYTVRMRSTSLFSAGSLALVVSREGTAALLSVEGTVAKRAAGMRLCQRRQPPKAVAAGQRLQSRIPAATIGRGARRAALFKSHSRWYRALPASRRIWYALWYRDLARATAWRRARLEDEGLAAQPLASLLICGARALLRCAAALPLADEPFVGLFGLTGQLDLPIT